MLAVENIIQISDKYGTHFSHLSDKYGTILDKYGTILDKYENTTAQNIKQKPSNHRQSQLKYAQI